MPDNDMDDSFDDIAEELRKEYVLDAKEHIDTIENLIVTLEKERTLGRGDVDRLFRAYHTIKGNSALVGFDNVRDLAHIVESVIGQFRSGEMVMSPRVADVILSSVDMLKKMVVEIEDTGKPVANPTALIKSIKDFKESYNIVQAAPPVKTGSKAKPPPKATPKPAPKEPAPVKKQVMKVKTTGNLAILQMPEQLDKELKADLIELIKSFQKRGISKFVLNFELTKSISQSGVDLIREIHQEIDSGGGKLASCEIPLDVMFTFNNSGSSDTINPKTDLRSAVLAVGWP